MPKDKSRSYANPVIAKLQFSDEKAVTVEVSDYQVTDKHVILTRKAGDSKIVKYVSISVLKTFEFDAPADYVPKGVPIVNPLWVGGGTSYVPTPSNVTMGSLTGAPVFEVNPVVARAKPLVERPPKAVEEATTESKLIDGAFKGKNIARMG